MNSNIILESERLIFRQHQPKDMDAYCSMEMDAAVRRYVGGRPRSRIDAEARFENSLKPTASSLGVWAAILKSTQEYIGRSGVYPHINTAGIIVPDESFLSFYIARKFWNCGYATEAGQAFVYFAFNKLKLKRILATVEVGNDASVHIIEKLGFKLDRKEEGQRSFYHFSLDNPQII